MEEKGVYRGDYKGYWYTVTAIEAVDENQNGQGEIKVTYQILSGYKDNIPPVEVDKAYPSVEKAQEDGKRRAEEHIDRLVVQE